MAGGSITRILMKSCFSCGDDPSQIPEGRPLNIEISMVKFSDSTCLIVGSAFRFLCGPE